MNNTVQKTTNNNTETEDKLAGGVEAEKLPDNKLLREAVTEDPLLRFFYSNQKFLSYMIIAILLAVLGHRYYQDAHVKNQQRSAEIFAGVHSVFNELYAEEGTDQENLEARKRQLDGSLKTLMEHKEPYNTLALNYKNLALVKEKKFDDVATKLKSILPDIKSGQSVEVYPRELLALYLAKSLINVEEHTKLAEESLRQLASSSSYVHTIAALALYSSANSPEKKASAKQVLMNLKAKHPEQAELIEAQIS